MTALITCPTCKHLQRARGPHSRQCLSCQAIAARERKAAQRYAQKMSIAKTCLSCGQTKPREFFYADHKRLKYRVKPVCISCMKQRRSQMTVEQHELIRQCIMNFLRHKLLFETCELRKAVIQECKVDDSAVIAVLRQMKLEKIINRERKLRDKKQKSYWFLLENIRIDEREKEIKAARAAAVVPDFVRAMRIDIDAAITKFNRLKRSPDAHLPGIAETDLWWQAAYYVQHAAKHKPA